ncbi:LysR family transcriptional regulator [Streptomyces sp. NBC_00820]|uniref:LysR family transcriptional regulator n=1 Tax=Streptomyces sp. NBC_00820 TaxID=2975842 RepID=UPI002ED3D74A|nr:LysR family transcriptional regulator [Streptomyces sp. NBC_00820]
MAMDKGAAAAKPYGSDIDLRKLRVLVELDRRGTVSAVAAALHLTPSAVSQQLAGLAKELDVALTEPVGRRLRLTGAAKVVLRHAEEIFESIERLHRALAEHRGGEHGEVSVSGFGTTLAPLILPAAGILKRRLPGLRTTLAEVDPPVSFELLELGRTDVVIAVESPTAPVLDRRFDKRPLMTEVFDVALPAEHPLADAPSLALGDLAEEAWIFATVGMCQEIPLAACAAAGFTPRATHVIGDWDATFAAVRQGLGICLVPRLARRSSQPGVAVRRFDEAPWRRVFAAVRSGSTQTPQIEAVLDALSEAAGVAESKMNGASQS